jgi:hypothetical protein
MGKVVGAGLTGDYNGDGVVDAADYTVWRDTLGQSVTPGSGADGDGDGTIDQGDYNTWVMHFGEQSPGSGQGASAAVPEPASWALLIVGLSLAGLRKVNSSSRRFER